MERPQHLGELAANSIDFSVHIIAESLVHLNVVGLNVLAAPIEALVSAHLITGNTK